MPKPRFTLISLPLAGVPPRKLTPFPRPVLGSAATVRQQLRTVADRVAPPTVPAQVFKLKAQPLTSRSVASIANVARSPNPGEQLIKQEKLGPEQLVGTIYTAMVAQQYKETKTQYQQALSQAARLPLATRVKATVAIEAGFKSDSGLDSRRERQPGRLTECLLILRLRFLVLLRHHGRVDGSYELLRTQLLLLDQLFARVWAPRHVGEEPKPGRTADQAGEVGS